MANTIDTIRENSLRVYNGMIIIYPLFASQEPIDISDIVELDNCYAVNNSVICYVYEHNVYVTPYRSSTIQALEESGFRENYFYVPFSSNGSYPKTEESQWNSLRERAEADQYF